MADEILSGAERTALAAVNARAAGLEASRDPWQGLPAVGDRVGLVAAIDHAVTILQQYNNPDLQFCVGYLEGFKELIERTTKEGGR